MRLYSNQEMIMFSNLNFEIENINKLIRIFNKSLEEKINLFQAGQEEIEYFCLKYNFYKYINFFLRDRDIKRELADKKIQICKRKNIQFIDFFSEKYPENLKKISNFPYVIYYRGILPTQNELKNSFAVVGTRFPKNKDTEFIIREIVKILKKYNFIEIGGLALGCDSYGHKFMLELGGVTGAILGQGLGTETYPRENRELERLILNKNGFIMSEIPPDEGINKKYLIMRNRLQSSLGMGIVVIESENTGGTIHTIKDSIKQNKKTFIWRGKNQLILSPAIVKKIKIIDKLEQFERELIQSTEQYINKKLF